MTLRSRRGEISMRVFVVSLIISLICPLAYSKLLFRDDFEGDRIGQEPSKWFSVDKPPGDPPGEVIQDPTDPNNKVFSPSKRGDRMGRVYVVGEPDWTDLVAEWDWYIVLDNCIGMVFRYQDRDNHYLFDRRAGWAQPNEIHFYKRVGGSWQRIGGAPIDPKLNQLKKWYRVQLKVEGNRFSVKVKERDDPTPFSELDVLLEVTDDTFKKGYFGIYAGEQPASAYFDNIVVGEREEDLSFALEPSSGLLAVKWGQIKKGR